MAVDIDRLQIEIGATSSDAAAKIDKLAASLMNLRTSASGGAGLTTVAKQLQALSNAANLINSTSLNIGKLRELTTALNGLGGIRGATGLNSTLNALKRLPEISAALERADFGKLATQMRAAASAIAPFANEMQRLANGFIILPPRIRRLIAGNDDLIRSNNRVTQSFGFAIAKFGIYLAMFRRVAHLMSGWVAESNDYVENLNLFNVAMGKYAEEAHEYANAVNEALGIDPSDWMRNQGVFMQITSGFGVVEDKAYTMSKNLTQIGYDISSFFNIGIKESMQKVQSGIAGELEPLRRLGYALDQATLQEIAYKHGIEQSFNTMNQAQKAQLRYIAIMEQSGNVMGDMARTVQTPANAMRILNQQLTQLARAAGNLLIPALQKIIPVVQAVVEVLTDAIQALANLFGFKLPTIDYSGLGNVSAGAEDAEESLEGATGAAKDFKKQLLGIDELTILEPTSSAGSGAGAAGGSDWDLALPEYDFLKGATAQQIEELKEKLKELLPLIAGIAAGLAAWAISSKLFKDLGLLQRLVGSLMIAAGVTLLIKGIKDIIDKGGNLDWKNLLMSGGGGALVGGGIGLWLAKKMGLKWYQGMLTGAVVGLGIGLVIAAITSDIMQGLNVGNALVAAIGGAIAGGAAAAGLSLKQTGKIDGKSVAYGAVVGIGISLMMMAITDQITHGVDIGNSILSMISGAVTGAGLAFKLGLGAAGTIGLITAGVGLAIAITGVISQIQNGFNLGDAIKTVLGTALAGAGIGTAIAPGVGTAVGFVIGLGVGLVIEWLGIQEAGEAAYAATENFKVMEEILGRCTEASQRNEAAMDSLSSVMQNLDSVVADFAIASQLADEIYAISENANASQLELQEMAVKVDILNSLNIDGLHLSIDETTGRVVEARGEVEELIATLQKEAQMEAMREIIVEAYRNQYQAMADAKTAAKDLQAAQESLNAAETELANTDWFAFQRKAELKAQIEQNTEAVSAAQEVITGATQVQSEANDMIQLVTDSLIEMQATTSDTAASYGADMQSMQTISSDTAQAIMADTGMTASEVQQYFADMGIAVEGWGDTVSTTAGDASEAISTASGDMEEAFGNASAAASDASGEMEKSVSEASDAIKEEMDDLKEDSKSWGVDMLDNLKRGMASKIGDIADTAKEIADTIADYLHFSEPDIGPLSNFHTFMPDMIDLMASGIYANEYKVANAAASVAESVRRQIAETNQAVANSANTFSTAPLSISGAVAQQISGSVNVADSNARDEGSLMVVNAIYAAVNRIVKAIEDTSSQDGGASIANLAEKMTVQQNRLNIMYGRTQQNV